MRGDGMSAAHNGPVVQAARLKAVLIRAEADLKHVDDLLWLKQNPKLYRLTHGRVRLTLERLEASLTELASEMRRTIALLRLSCDSMGHEN